MPGDACLKSRAPIAVVTITWSPHTIGDDQPRPAISARHATLIVVDHLVGSVATDDTARPAGPRNCGQVASTGSGAGTNAVTNTVSTEPKRRYIGGSVTRTTAVLY